MNWTRPMEQALLSRWDGGKGAPALAEEFGKTVSAVVRKANKLGLSKVRPELWTADQIKTLRVERGNGKSFSQIGKIVGKSKNAVIGRAKRDGLESIKLAPQAETRPKRLKPVAKPCGPRVACKGVKGCQWLEGEPRQRNFCGKDLRPGSAYCQEHWYKSLDHTRRKMLDNPHAIA